MDGKVSGISSLNQVSGLCGRERPGLRVSRTSSRHGTSDPRRKRATSSASGSCAREPWPAAAGRRCRYLSGGTLPDLIARSRESAEGLPVERILVIATEIAHGLAYIHGRRIFTWTCSPATLYLDLQPRNVLFDERGTVHLVDFDAAVPLDQPDVSHLADRPVIVYTAPEVTGDGGADERADLYSLGATIYEMAAGRPPFAGSREEILAARRAGPPPPLDREDLPHTLRDLVFSLLSADREQRPVTAAQVIERLDAISTARADIERLLSSDESARLEFKSSLRVPLGPPPPGTKKTAKDIERDLELAVLKTLAAFLNTEGGTLIVGVADDGTVVGIEVDFPRVRESRDGWRKPSTTSSPAILEPRC